MQAGAEIERCAGASHGFHHGVVEALDEAIGSHGGHHPKFLKGDDAAGAQELGQCAEGGGRIGQVAEDEAADDGIEGLRRLRSGRDRNARR